MELIVLFFSALISAFLSYRIIKSKKKVKKKTEEFKFPLEIKGKYYPNAHQSVVVYKHSENNHADLIYFFTTITLKKTFDPSLLFEIDENEYLTINLIFSSNMSNFYIFKKKPAFKHWGIQFSTENLLNNTQYKIFGCINDKLMDFSRKHNFEYFYNSYIPENENVVGSLKQSFAELKINLRNITESFYLDFIALLSSFEHENPKKLERIIKNFKAFQSKKQKDEKKGFFEKVNSLIKEKQNTRNK